jgi:hypothetical protein
MPKKKKDWPVIVAGASLALGFEIYLLVGVWFLTEAPSMLDVVLMVPAAALLIAFGCVLAIGLGVWRTVRFLVRGPEPEELRPEAPAKALTWKQALLTLVVGMLLSIGGCATYVDQSDRFERGWWPALIGSGVFLSGLLAFSIGILALGEYLLRPTAKQVGSTLAAGVLLGVGGFLICSYYKHRIRSPGVLWLLVGGSGAFVFGVVLFLLGIVLLERAIRRQS